MHKLDINMNIEQIKLDLLILKELSKTNNITPSR